LRYLTYKKRTSDTSKLTLTILNVLQKLNLSIERVRAEQLLNDFV
jgi:hypothetical protein